VGPATWPFSVLSDQDGVVVAGPGEPFTRPGALQGAAGECAGWPEGAFIGVR